MDSTLCNYEAFFELDFLGGVHILTYPQPQFLDRSCPENKAYTTIFKKHGGKLVQRNRDATLRPLSEPPACSDEWDDGGIEGEI